MNWPNHIKTQIIDPETVDLHDCTYLIPYFSESSALMESIQRFGMLNAPIIQKLSEDRIVPIVGRRRLLCAIGLGLKEIRAKVLGAEISVSECFVLAFWDNASHRVFDIAAKAVVIRRLLELFPRNVVAKDFLPALGIPPRGPRLERLRSIGGLEHSILEALALGNINENTAALLCEIDPNTRLKLMKLSVDLRLNANKFAEITSGLFDLSIVGSRSIDELLMSDDVNGILNDAETLVPARAEQLRRLIRAWKFPELTEREIRFREWSKSIPHSDKLSIRPAPAFEDPSCTIEIKVDFPADAERIVSILGNAAKLDK